MLISAGTTFWTITEGTAKPMPAEAPDCDSIAVGTPTRRPLMSTSTPPELPGLTGASVWMMSGIV